MDELNKGLADENHRLALRNLQSRPTLDKATRDVGQLRVQLSDATLMHTAAVDKVQVRTPLLPAQKDDAGRCYSHGPAHTMVTVGLLAGGDGRMEQGGSVEQDASGVAAVGGRRAAPARGGGLARSLPHFLPIVLLLTRSHESHE